MSIGTDTPDYTETLRGWWENAHQGAAAIGDTVIVYHDEAGGIYEVYTWDEADAMGRACVGPPRRILRRATPPEPAPPAWVDAPAVLATYYDYADRKTGVCVKDSDGMWDTDYGTFHWSLLEDVTPLYPDSPYDPEVRRAYLLDALVNIGYVDEDGMGEVPDAELDALIAAVLDR